MLFFVSSVFAQNETNNWYFGDNGGMNFDNGDFSVLNDGSMQTPAGCTSISDRDGNLLFYTNGQTVWNKNHEIMENGTDLAGEIDGVQTSIIIPRPNNENSYYIFTTRINQTNTPYLTPPGLYFSEVVFSDQYPLGYIFTKNTRILNSLTQRLAAIHHYQTNTIRLIVLGYIDPPPPDEEFPFPELPHDPPSVSNLANAFRIFNITENGIQSPSITLEIQESLSPVGAMKISPNGKLIAVADNYERYLHLYNFDNDNVTIQYEKSINADIPFAEYYPYGVEFSPNSEILYYSASGILFQFPLSPNEDGMFLKYALGNIGANSLQLARNGKIYVTRGGDSSFGKIGVVNKPDKTGTEANFQSAQVDLESGSSRKGLPIFIASYMRNRIMVSDDDCVGTTFNFELDAYVPIISTVWDFGDGMTSTSLTPTHQFSEPGIYKVSATIMVNNYPVTLYRDVEVYPFPSLDPNQTLGQCDTDNDGTSFFNLENIGDKMNNPNPEYEYTFYHSQNDAENDINPIPNHQTYQNQVNPEEIFVKITSPKGCVTISNFFIETTYTELGPINPIYTCEDSDNVLNNGEGVFNIDNKIQEIRQQFNFPSNFSIKVYATVQDAQTKANSLPRYYTSSSTTVWIRVEDENQGCNGIGSFQLIVNQGLETNIEDRYVICDKDLQPLTVLDGGANNDIWEWRNSSDNIISTSRHFALSQTGTFSLTVYKTENGIQCSVRKQFVVTQAGTVAFNEVSTEDNQIYVSVIGQGVYEFSIDGYTFFGQGESSYTFTGIETGFHIVYVRDVYNCESPISQEVFLLNFPRFFTPNGDGINDYWRISSLSTRFFPKIEIYIYDRYGKFIKYINVKKDALGWDGTLKGEKIPATDYWFKAVMKDVSGNVIEKKGHFSLVR